MLELEKPASTSGVRTHRNFGIIPSPFAVDIDHKMVGGIMIGVDKLRNEFSMQKLWFVR